MSDTTAVPSVRYSRLHVKLTSVDGNVFMLIGATRSALKRADVPPHELTEFAEGCFAQPSYDDVLRYIMTWVNVA